MVPLAHLNRSVALGDIYDRGVKETRRFAVISTPSTGGRALVNDLWSDECAVIVDLIMNREQQHHHHHYHNATATDDDDHHDHDAPRLVNSFW